jgi:hypothetical protein
MATKTARVLGWILAAGLLVDLASGGRAFGRQDPPTYTFRSARAAGGCDRVVGLLEAGGEVKEPGDGKVERLKMSVVCNFSFDERTLETPEIPEMPDGRVRSIRFYDRAEAVVRVEEDGVQPVLRPDRRLIVAETSGRSVTLFSPRGPLSRDELDLIDVLGNSLLLDRLLPAEPVAMGDSWKLPKDLVIAMLGLDEAAEADVEATLTEVTETAARFQLAGGVSGAISGVSSTIDLKGRYRFSRKAGRVDWLGLLVREQRGISHVKRGVDAVARLQLTVVPIDEPDHLSDAALAGLALEPLPERTLLVQEAADGAWNLTHDRTWHLTGAEPNSVVLKKVARGELIAQCNLSPLPARESAKQLSLADFQADVQRALGENFGEFVSASQQANAAGHRVYRVVVHGTVSELLIEWRYYLVTDEHGRRVAFAFTLVRELAEKLGDDDRQIVDSLRFREAQVAAKRDP